jgi:hypothetical protein
MVARFAPARHPQLGFDAALACFALLREGNRNTFHTCTISVGDLFWGYALDNQWGQDENDQIHNIRFSQCSFLEYGHAMLWTSKTMLLMWRASAGLEQEHVKEHKEAERGGRQIGCERLRGSS